MSTQKQQKENLVRLRERKIGQARTLSWLSRVVNDALQKEQKHIRLITEDLEEMGIRPVSVRFSFGDEEPTTYARDDH